MSIFSLRKGVLLCLAIVSALGALGAEEAWYARYSPEAFEHRSVAQWLHTAYARELRYSQDNDAFATRLESLDLAPYDGGAWTTRLVAGSIKKQSLLMIEVDDGTHRLCIDQNGKVYRGKLQPFPSVASWSPSVEPRSSSEARTPSSESRSPSSESRSPSSEARLPSSEPRSLSDKHD